jgi:hypothetical protein
VLLFLWFLSLCLVLSIFNSPTISTYESRDWWCAALLWFLSLRLVLRVFFNSPTISTYESRLSDVLLFLIPFFRLVLGIFLVLQFPWRVFFNSPKFYLWSRDWWCCSFVITFGLRSIFQQSYPFLPMKAGLSDVLLFVIPFFSLVFFSTVLPNFYLWSRVEWCAALLWFLSFVWS